MNRRSARHGWGCLVALPLLASCALGPKVPTPDVTLPAAFSAQTAPAQTNIQIDHWWALYGDPQLESLIDQALRNAPDARSAQARLAEALAVRSEALAAFRPQGALQAQGARMETTTVAGPPPEFIPGIGYVSLTNNGFENTYGGAFNVSWELDLFGRSFVTRKKANADLAVARFDYEASRTSLAANVADQLFQARGLAIQLRDTRETADLEHQLLEVARAKDIGGVGAHSDAEQTASEAGQTDAQVADLQTQLIAARRTMMVLIGQGGAPIDSLKIAAEAGSPPAIPTSVPAELLARRPDVREAAAQIISAAGTLKLDELALFPTFTLQPGINLAAAYTLGTPIITDTWTAGAGVMQPILNMPKLKSEIHAQGARADQAVIAYEKAVRTAYGEADNALVQLGSDEARVKLLTTAEAQGRDAYDASKARFAAGIDDLTTVLTAERTWRTARAALTSAQIQALRRSAQAFKALGGGWAPPPLTQVRR